MPDAATIGVYGWSPATFRAALEDAGARLVVDVRQRRGVRGSEYAWANSQRLQAALAEAGIDYRHRKDLAPTTGLRQLQYRADAKAGVGRRSRSVLAAEYAERYTAEILEHVDLRAFVESLPADGLTVLLCVERDPEACHRSLIAQRLEEDHGIDVGHLLPA